MGVAHATNPTVTTFTANSQGAATFTIPSVFDPFLNGLRSNIPARVLVKIIAPANEPNFQFQASVVDANSAGQPFPVGSMLVKLDAFGGL